MLRNKISLILINKIIEFFMNIILYIYLFFYNLIY